ncbi:MAG: MarR family transcriptional regulator [Oscillospiraceae bacterium]|nr:MarR family transcriptional regulator [Oscillospiraceae bacterium]
MAEEAEIQKFMHIMDQMHPVREFSKIDATKAGIGAVMRFLDESGQSVTAGEISDGIHVSTARVAVLLRKMEAKGLIIRKSHDRDARITMVCLTEDGEKIIRKMHQRMQKNVERMIDQIGAERLETAFTVMQEIRGILESDCE